MIHACIRRFDVTGTVEKFLLTKQGLRMYIAKSTPNRSRYFTVFPVSFFTVFFSILNPNSCSKTVWALSRSPQGVGVPNERLSLTCFRREIIHCRVQSSGQNGSSEKFPKHLQNRKDAEPQLVLAPLRHG